jgi:hypothetical protein
MKLIRLTTRDTEAVFDNIFSDELIMKKDGKIALQNVAIQLAPFEFVVNDNNKKITYQNSTAGDVVVELTEATYNDTNYHSLFTDIQNKLNESTNYDGTNNRVLGVEWKCEIPSTDSRIVIEYKRGDLIKDDRYSFLNEIQTGTPQPGERLYLTDDNVPANAGFNYNRTTKRFVARGCSYTRAHVWGLNNSGGGAPVGINLNGMILALTTRDLTDVDPDDIAEADITFGIWATINAGGVRQYYVYNNGVRTFSPIVPDYVGDGSADNDDLEIIITAGLVTLNVIRANGTKEPLGFYDYTPGTKLYPLEVWHGGSQTLGGGTPTAIFSNIAYIDSPYDEHTPSPLLGLGAEIPVPEVSPYDNYLEFDNMTLAEYLGFQRKRQPATGFKFVSEATYRADYAFTVFEKSDACLVEMQNIPLDSYDGFKNQRKNLLAVVPKSDANGEIIYEPNTPFFIDIHNESDLLLRNIRARIVRTDYRTLKTRGLTTLTILVSD